MEENVWFETIINNNLRNKSVSKVINCSIERFIPEGMNLSSLIYKATLDIILHSGRKSKLSLIIKRKHQEDEKAAIEVKFSIFKRETMFYKDVLSQYEQLMDDYQDNGEKLWCKMIGYQPYKSIVFEDLKMQNFKMAERTEFLDKNHAMLVLHSLGRFHAMGHILLKRGIISKDDFHPYFFGTDSPLIFSVLGDGVKQLSNAIENHWTSEWQEIAKRLKVQVDLVVGKIRKLVNSSEKYFETVLHGDCWTCNMMFKYCPYDEKVPVAMKFLDFQGPHVNSHAFDITYLMYVSVRPEVRRAHYDELIAEYHKSLKSTLTIYGMEASAPTLDQTHAELKRLQYYAFIMNIIILPATIADADQALVIENFTKTNEGKSAYHPGIFKSDRFKSAIQPDLKEWLEQGLY